MSEIIFKGAKIQKGFRVKIPKPIIDTLNLKSREKILIKFDLDKREITIKEDKEGLLRNTSYKKDNKKIKKSLAAS
jgi:bifunctional DNA-binding transcriptional regulator/antitoxin component of YhaV-PrlF toxin-antitoxin module